MPEMTERPAKPKRRNPYLEIVNEAAIERLAEGGRLTREELATIVAVNGDLPLPSDLRNYLVSFLRDDLGARRGRTLRPKAERLAIAELERFFYERALRVFKRQRRGSKPVTSPHELAAEYVAKKVHGGHIQGRSVRNRLSLEKGRRDRSSPL